MIFYLLYKDLCQRYSQKFDIRKVDLSAYGHSHGYGVRLVWRFLKALGAIPNSDVVLFQAPYRYVHVMGPIFYLMSRLVKTPIVLRRSAGNNIELFQRQPRWFQKILARTILNADLSCYETDYEVAFFRQISQNPVLFIANNRPMVSVPWKPLENPPRRFLYLGNISREKGVHHLLAIFPELAQQLGITLTLYGKDQLGIEGQSFPGVRYGGLLPHEAVQYAIAEADVLILPSYREGIPGVIIEAFMYNKPVIATNLPSIQQIVHHNQNGLLVEPGNEAQLAQAIRRLHADVALYNKLTKYIAQNKHLLSTEYWTDELVKAILQLV